MELEKPVIGTIVPAPATLPILSYTLIAVSNAAININIIVVIVEAVFLSNP